MLPEADFPLPPVGAGFVWREASGTKWIEGRAGSAQAAFTTRLGGVSEGPFASLNLGLSTGDERDRVLENRRLAAAAVGLDPERIAIGRQVHGGDLMVHEISPRPYFCGGEAGPPEVDGHVLGESAEGVAGLVFVADCLPIVLGGTDGVAVVHGGWRGLAAGIVQSAVARVQATDMAIGPAIGPCCYEVGEEVHAEFAGLGTGIAEGRRLDLAAVATVLARQAGVERVICCAVCTACNPELFFSHRNQGPGTGRQAGIGWSDG